MPFGLFSNSSNSQLNLIPAGVSSDRTLVQLGASNPFIGVFDDQGHVRVNNNEYLTVTNGKLALTPNAPGAIFSDNNGFFIYPEGRGFLANTNSTLPFDILISRGTNDGNTPFELRIVYIRTENVTTTITTKITTVVPPPLTSFANVTSIPITSFANVTSVPITSFANVTTTRSVSLNTTIAPPVITTSRTMTQINGGVEAIAGFGAAAVAGVAALLL